MTKNILRLLALVILAGSNVSQASLVESIRSCIQRIGGPGIEYWGYREGIEWNCSQRAGAGYLFTDFDRDMARISYQLARDIDNTINPNFPTIVNEYSSYDVTYTREDLGLTARCSSTGYPYLHSCYVSFNVRNSVNALLDRF